MKWLCKASCVSNTENRVENYAGSLQHQTWLDFVREPVEATNRKKLCLPEQEGIVVAVMLDCVAVIYLEQPADICLSYSVPLWDQGQGNY